MKKGLNECVNYYSHCCNKIPNKSNSRKEGSVYFSTRVQSATAGKAWRQELKRLVTLHPQSGSRDTGNAGAQLDLSFFIQSATPACRVALPIVRMGFPSSVKWLRKCPHGHQRCMSQVILGPVKLTVRMSLKTAPWDSSSAPQRLL